MATHRISIMGNNTLPDSGVFPDRIGNQITATNQVGDQNCLVIADGGSDVGFQDDFEVPQNYAGSGVISVIGILDGAMSTNTLQFGVRGLPIVDNEASDAAYSTEDTGSNTTDHADEDLAVVSITLSNLSLVAGDRCLYLVYIDASGNDYTGNFLLLDVVLQYSDT